jgi:glycosyltransferase involved in cell wall biosynthesis
MVKSIVEHIQNLLGLKRLPSTFIKGEVALSIIIPTYNEENYISGILSDLSNQNFDKAFEVILVDTSTDNTLKVAQQFSNKLNLKAFRYESGRGVSRQRNYGAKLSQTNRLLFIDADTRLPNYSLSSLWEKAISKGYGVSTSTLKPNSNNILDIVSMFFYNLYAIARNPISPIAAGAYMFVRKEVFNKVGGFNPKISFAEDFDIVQKARRIGYSQKYIYTPLFLFSVRRIKDMGRFRFILRTLYNGLVLLLPQKISERIVFGYKMEGHSTKKI